MDELQLHTTMRLQEKQYDLQLYALFPHANANASIYAHIIANDNVHNKHFINQSEIETNITHITMFI